MRYFIEDVKIFKTDFKWEELKQFVTTLRQQLVADEQTLELLKGCIQEHIFQLNRFFPRTRPMMLSGWESLTEKTWKIYVAGDTESLHCNKDKVLCNIHIREVHGHIHISLQDGETLEFSPQTDEKSSANRVDS